MLNGVAAAARPCIWPQQLNFLLFIRKIIKLNVGGGTQNKRNCTNTACVLKCGIGWSNGLCGRSIEYRCKVYQGVKYHSKIIVFKWSYPMKKFHSKAMQVVIRNRKLNCCGHREGYCKPPTTSSSWLWLHPYWFGCIKQIRLKTGTKWSRSRRRLLQAW